MRESKQIPRGLIVGNYCHDVLFKDDVVIAETLGGAASFISAVLDGLSSSSHVSSKVGPDFAYSSHVSHHPPILSSSSSPTTLFHAHFSSSPNPTRRDRVLKRVQPCDPIFPSDLPSGSRFNFGMAVGVGGEILPETLEKMLDLCDTVFADIQSLIRTFHIRDGIVGLMKLEESGFYHLLPRLGFLKASAEEATLVDVEEARKWCFVVVTNGKDGCTLYWKDGGECRIPPFPAIEVDPTGAGDCFLGGFSAGLMHGGLSIPNAALLGNFFGSLTVAQIGVPVFDSKLMQQVEEEMQRRKTQNCSCGYGDIMKPALLVGHDEEFHSFLASAAAAAAAAAATKHNSQISPAIVQQQQVGNEDDIAPHFCNRQNKFLASPAFEEPPIQSLN